MNEKKVLPPIDRILSGIEENVMDRLLQRFSVLDRLSGTPDADAAVDYILQELDRLEIKSHCYEFPAYLCDPLDSSLTLYFNGEELSLPCRPRSFSDCCQEGLTAELWYHETESVTDLPQKAQALKGKIVVSGNYDEDYARMLSDLGAAALIQVWKSHEEIEHEDTVGCVWGTPTEKTEPTLTRIPVVGVTAATGRQLIQAALQEKGPAKARLVSCLNYRVGRLRLPVAVIPGKSEDFALLSGHYDSWYFGATDNGTGNALCLELARLFQKEQGQLERGVLIAWWPGHSNGRYAGSTWYCDNHWANLADHCVAHINIDSPGCKGAERVVIGTTGFEGTGFSQEIIKRHTGFSPMGFSQLFKGADQSFFGCGIPIHIYPMYKQSPNNQQYASPGSGGGWWWHTPADTLDKVDMEILKRDTGYIAHMLGQIVFSSELPCCLEEYFSYLSQILTGYSERSGPEFDFTEIINCLDVLGDTVTEALSAARENPEIKNRIYKAVGGQLNRLLYTYSDPYTPDRAMPAPLFPGVGIVDGIFRETCPDPRHLFILTEFVRQRNRLLREIKLLTGEVRLLRSQLHPRAGADGENSLAASGPSEGKE